MFDLYTNLRTMAKKSASTTTINIRKSGFTMKVVGIPGTLDDAGVEALVKAQPVIEGRLDTSIKGKAETETHKGNVVIPSPFRDDVLSTMRGEGLEAPAKRETKAQKEAREAEEARIAKDAEALKDSRNGVPVS